MMGKQDSTTEAGIIPRLCKDLFKQIGKYRDGQKSLRKLTTIIYKVVGGAGDNIVFTYLHFRRICYDICCPLFFHGPVSPTQAEYFLPALGEPHVRGQQIQM